MPPPGVTSQNVLRTTSRDELILPARRTQKLRVNTPAKQPAGVDSELYIYLGISLVVPATMPHCSVKVNVNGAFSSGRLGGGSGIVIWDGERARGLFLCELD